MQDTAEKAQVTQGENIGFIGLGVMGKPMALNLARAGTPLIVWNRSSGAAEELANAGAEVAKDLDDLFAMARVVILMLVNEHALDEVLGRGTPEFSRRIAGHTIVSMGSNPPEYSRALAEEIAAAGGYYVEAPVSGSRKPAEAGHLVCMLGGDPETLTVISPLLAPMCRSQVNCGPVGNALLMKLTVNLFLNTMLAGLAEAVHFANAYGLDTATFQQAVDAGPMDCEFTRIKVPKLAARDFAVQAATADAYNSTRLIANAARQASIATPLLDAASNLYGESVELGNGREDMISVIKAIEARSSGIVTPASKPTAN